MYRLSVVISILFMTAIFAAGDTVYLNDGREIEGTVTKKDGSVVVELPNGRKMTYSSDDVLYIAEGPVKKGSSTPQQTAAPAEVIPLPAEEPATQPARETATQPADEKTPESKPAAPKAEDKDTDNPDQSKRQGQLFTSTMNTGAIDPAQMLYEYLRRRPSGPGSGGPGLEELIKTARVRIHDRERKVGLNWFKPDDFVRRRKAFDAGLEEARQLFRQAAQMKPETAAEKTQQKLLQDNAQNKLEEAAKSYADPLLRKFLLGVAYYNAEKFNPAVQTFSRGRNDAPVIAGFWQGFGLALRGQRVYRPAISCAFFAFMLTDDRAMGLTYLKEALSETPGNLMGTEEARNAKKIADHFNYIKTKKLTGKRQYWLMPGRNISCTTETLPQLGYDRLVVRQGIAVPITENCLLAGSDIVEGADYVIVKLLDWLWMPAKVDKLGSDSDVVALYIPDVRFNPMTIVKNSSFKKDEYFNLITADIFPSMSGQVDMHEITVKSTSGFSVSFISGLQPGQGTSPVVDSSGKLAGFLLGKLKTDVDTFPDKFMPVTTGSKFLRRIKVRTDKPKHGKGSSQNQEFSVPGQSFMIYAVGTETFR